MITASLRLTGVLNDDAEVYRSYMLVADFAPHGGGTASIIPMSGGAPMPEDDHLQVRYGGEEGALKAAAEIAACNKKPRRSGVFYCTQKFTAAGCWRPVCPWGLASSRK
jgi:hypothetical protein